MAAQIYKNYSSGTFVALGARKAVNQVSVIFFLIHLCHKRRNLASLWTAGGKKRWGSLFRKKWAAFYSAKEQIIMEINLLWLPRLP